jgi:heat shock protein HslJ
MTGIYWKLVELDGHPALAMTSPHEAHLRISDDGSTVAGATGCNGFRGRAELAGDRVKFGPLASTLMACVDPELGSREQRFLRALESADRLATQGDAMTMYASNRMLARFKAVYLR